MADRGHKKEGSSQEKVPVPHPPPSKRRVKNRRKQKKRCFSETTYSRTGNVVKTTDSRPKTSENRRPGPPSPRPRTVQEAWPTHPGSHSGAPQDGCRRSSLSGIRLPSLGSISTDQCQGQAGTPPPPPPPPKKKKLSVLAAVKPYNQEAERERFFCSNFTYNPQFTYRSRVEPEIFKKYGTHHAKYLDLAVHIMKTALTRYGSYEAFERRTGGRILTKSEIYAFATDYLRKEKLEDKVFINLSEDLVSRGSMTRVKGRATLNVRTDSVRGHWMEGLLRHEVGTHYFRAMNNQKQEWKSGKRRSELKMGPANPTEEGLASLHSVLFRKDPSLWRSALLYYTTYQAAFLSFVDLFEDIGQFVADPYVKWDYCLRSKRGLTDTSLPGAFCKDQVYLNGALQILKFRDHIDFHTLTKLGKISYRDVDKIRDHGDLENTRVPAFMVNMELYRDCLERIMQANGLTDYELEEV